MSHSPGRPGSNEYADFYGTYIAAVEEPLLDTLEAEAGEWGALLGSVPPDREGYRYAPGKWSVREVVGHVIDAERMFTVRAMAFARGDRSHYPAFDEHAFAANSGADRRPLADLAEELAAVRRSDRPAAEKPRRAGLEPVGGGQRVRIHGQEPGLDHRGALPSSPEGVGGAVFGEIRSEEAMTSRHSWRLGVVLETDYLGT